MSKIQVSQFRNQNLYTFLPQSILVSNPFSYPNVLPTESTQCPLKMLLRTYKGFDFTLHSSGPPDFFLYLDIQVILLVSPPQTPSRSDCSSKHLFVGVGL